MAELPDFWGNIEPTGARTPVGILREQARLLGPKTHNWVNAAVATDRAAGPRSAGGTFVHRFNLVVPSLDHLTYTLFTISHGIESYPVHVWDTDLRLNTEAELVEWLRQSLSDPETGRIVSTLLAQAAD